MRLGIFITATMLLMALGGCIPSLCPLYTPETLTTLPELTGMWEENSEEGENDRWSFEQADSLSYTLSYSEDSVPAFFEAHVIRLDKNLFIDIRPEPPDVENNLQKALLLPLHMFGRIELKGDSLSIAWLDGEWLKKMLESKGVSITHTFIDSDLLLTAEPMELQKLVLKHLNDPEAFPVSKFSRASD